MADLNDHHNYDIFLCTLKRHIHKSKDIYQDFSIRLSITITSCILKNCTQSKTCCEVHFLPPKNMLGLGEH